MSEREPVGKVTDNNVEKKLNVDGLEVETKTVGDVVEVPIPQEIKDKGSEAVEKFKRSAEDILINAKKFEDYFITRRKDEKFR